MVENLSERGEQFKARTNERVKLFWIDMAVSCAAIVPAGAVTIFSKNEPGSFPLVLTCVALSFTGWAVAVRHPFGIFSDTERLLRDLYKS